MKKFFKQNLTPFILNVVLLIYVGCILGVSIDGRCMMTYLFGKMLSIGYVLILMFFFELLSTFTFQWRMKLTSKYEDAKALNKPTKITPGLIAFIGGMSWVIASVESMFLLTDVSTWWSSLIKLFPVFVATFNGVYYQCLMKN